jgi:hypothetical protein
MVQEFMAEDAVTSEPFLRPLFPGIREENREFEAENGRILADTPHRNDFAIKRAERNREVTGKRTESRNGFWGVVGVYEVL